MSRKRDRERLEAQKQRDPDYRGFRGTEREPERTGGVPLVPVVCTVCGRKRNVPLGVAQRERDHYVCMACREREDSAKQGGG
ncbi:MAG: hypothetical protein HY683_02300 [Chloroflexi bacterium]|nr:hypothetical protein [Chloroflexota bacterium]